MTTPDGPNSDVAQLIQAIKDNAQRLGLTWQIVMAAVVNGDDSAAVALQFDGDDTTTPGGVSMLGSLAAGERVYVVQVPPAGLYIIGRAIGQYRARLVLGNSMAQVTIPNIPANLRSLRAVWSARSDSATQTTSLTLQVGGDATVSYAYQNDQATNATLAAGANIAATAGFMGFGAGGSAPAGVYGSGTVDFESWDLAPSGIARSLGWTWLNQIIGGALANAVKTSGGGRYSGTKARTSLTIISGSGNFVAGSDFQLIGEPS